PQDATVGVRCGRTGRVLLRRSPCVWKQERAGARPLIAIRYFAAATASASLVAAAAEAMSELKCSVTTSRIAPLTAPVVAISWAMEGSSEWFLMERSRSSIDLMAQASNLSRLTPRRAGIEPL